MNLDGRIVEFFARHPLPHWLEEIARLLKQLGEGDDLSFLCILFGIYAFFKRDGKAMRASGAGILALTLSGPIVQTLKRLIGRARPGMNLGDFHFIGPTLVKNGFDSFPSGHAMSSFTLAAFFARFYPKGKFYFYGLATAISLIGRVALREHYLSDVLVGGLLGILLGFFLARICEPWVTGQNREKEGSKESAGSEGSETLARGTFQAAEPSSVPHWKNLAVIAAFSGAILFFGLDRSALWDRDETEYAQAALEMEQSGDWLIPTLEGEPFIEKPILLYWVTLASTRIFGKNETGYRFPSALMGVFCCVLTYFIAQLLWGGGTGLKSALALASSILFAGCFNMLMTDPLFIFFSLLSLLFYILSRKNENRSLFFLTVSYTAIGLSALAKGPVAFFPIPVFLLFEYMTRTVSSAEFIRRNVLKSAALSLIPAAIAAPWFFYAFSKEQKATSAFFVYDNLIRFARGMEGHTGPAFYYVVVLALGFFPWSVFFIHAVVQNWRDRALGSSLAAESSLLLTWILFLFIFFSASANKLPHYIAPVLPVMACWIGKFWDDQTVRPQNLSPSFLWTLVFSGILLLAPLALFPFNRPQYASTALFLPFLLMFAAILIARHFALRGSWRKSFTLISASGFLFLGAAKLWSFPWIERFRVMRPMGLTIQERVPPNAQLFGYFLSEPSLFIYGGRIFPKIEDVSLDSLLVRQEPVYVIVPEKWMQTAGLPYEILAKFSGFAENSGEITLYLIKNKI